MFGSRTTIFILITAGVLFGGLLFVFLDTPRVVPEAQQPAYSTVTIAGVPIRVRVADTEALRIKGLSGTRGLAPDEGLLFIFETSGKYPFWMKDMLFPIDIIWLDEQFRIVHIAHTVAPDTYPQLFVSDVPARFVLEVPAGFSTTHNLSKGLQAIFEK